MTRVLDKVVSLIAPELKERFLLAFPSEGQPKTRIYFGETIAEIENGTFGYYFSVKSRHSGKLLASGAENTLQDALRRIFEKMKNHSGQSELPHTV
jgi:hypothetical protein